MDNEYELDDIDDEEDDAYEDDLEASDEDIYEDNDDDDDEEYENTDVAPYREFYVDDFCNVKDYKVDELEALKIWIYFALNVPRGRYDFLSDDYGNDLEDIIGTSSDMDYIEAMAEYAISECLRQNSHIQGITDFEMTQERDKAVFTFTVETDFGEVDTNVEI